jgi:ABC-type taurine transport system ATPase subunit
MVNHFGSRLLLMKVPFSAIGKLTEDSFREVLSSTRPAWGRGNFFIDKIIEEVIEASRIDEMAPIAQDRQDVQNRMERSNKLILHNSVGNCVCVHKI